MDEKKLLDYQIVTSIGSIIAIIVSIILIYNQELNIENKPTIFSSKTTRNITIFNRTIILVFGLVFLYVNYQFKKISNDDDSKQLDLQILASYFIILAAIIALYVAIKNEDEDISDIENPII